MEQPSFGSAEEEIKNEKTEKDEKKGLMDKFNTKIKNAVGAGTLAVAASVASMPNTAEAQSSFGLNHQTMQNSLREMQNRKKEQEQEFLQRITPDASALLFFSKYGLTLGTVQDKRTGKLAVCFIQDRRILSNLCYNDSTERAALGYDEGRGVFTTTIFNRDGSSENGTFRPVFNQQGEIVEFDTK